MTTGLFDVIIRIPTMKGHRIIGKLPQNAATVVFQLAIGTLFCR
jgi:hypothetical protein